MKEKNDAEELQRVWGKEDDWVMWRAGWEDGFLFLSRTFAE